MGHATRKAVIHTDDILGFAPELPDDVFLYCDPPWTQAVLAQFYRRVNRVAPPLREVLTAVARESRRCTGAVVEMGPPGLPLMMDVLRDAGWEELLTRPATYARGSRKSFVIQAGGHAIDWPETPLDSAHLPFHVLGQITEATVYDPCCGNGLTAPGSKVPVTTS